jgi:hypothetical protein
MSELVQRRGVIGVGFLKPIRRRQPNRIRDETISPRSSCSGNFLYATMALKAVERGQLDFKAIELLPPGLSGMYNGFFDRLYAEAGVEFRQTRDVAGDCGCCTGAFTAGGNRSCVRSERRL